MRVCVFVDGENLRHTICGLFDGDFDERDYLPKNADWAALFDHIVNEATKGEGKRLRTYWYVVQNIDPFPQLLPKRDRDAAKLDGWCKHNQKLVDKSNYTIPAEEPQRSNVLTAMMEELWINRDRIRSRFDGWTTLQNGISHKHRSIEFRRSGAISYNLSRKRFGQEKTVDVNLAVDMVTLDSNYDTAVIVSGDQDYVPAAQAAKNKGKHVVNVAFKARNGLLLPGGAKRLNQVTDWSIEVDWGELKRFLAI
jgi:uncharacterized LabA/DUF88 family protein